jgi:hypothetical protein
MKFSIAAGILVQTLPVISDQPAPKRMSHEINDSDGVAQVLGKMMSQARARSGKTSLSPSAKGSLKNALLTNAKPCNPASIDPDVGILSCDHGYGCAPAKNSLLGGMCVPQLPSEAKALAIGRLKNDPNAARMAMKDPPRECDPDADIGVLGCSKTQECVVNPASSLGGLCTTTSRQLVQYSTDAGICIPGHPFFQAYDCDCSGFDTTTGTGVVPCVAFANQCLGEAYSGCDFTCVTRTVQYNFTEFTAPGYSFCFNFSTPYPQQVCLEEKFEEGSCSITFDDVPCASCEVMPYGNFSYFEFDCSNAGGKKGNTALSNIDLLPILSRCGLKYCDLCGPDEFVAKENYGISLNIPIDGYAGATCGSLIYPAYENVTIDFDTCFSVSKAARSGGCCVPYTPPTYNCNICGDEMLYKDIEVEIQGYTLSCGSFQPLLNGSTCERAAPLLSETCCRPILKPSVAPTAPPPSSEAAMWGANFLVSLMGLAGATTGALLLN